MNSCINESELLPVQTDVPGCYCCGLDNPMGLKMRFFKEGDTQISSVCEVPSYWSGWGKIMHGGFHGVLLDEITASVAYGLMRVKAFVTKEIKVKYHRPAYTGQTLYLSGELIKDDGKKILLHGEIKDENNTLLSEAESIIIRLNPETMNKIMKG